MKRLLVVALILALTLPSHVFAQEHDAPGKCGVERWAVKTLTDSDMASVDLIPRSMTVESLRSLNGGQPAIASMSDAKQYANRRLEAEKHAVTVRAVLVGWKRENDRDFHIVIASPNDPSATMIAEPPDPSCSSSPHAKQFAAVRAAMVQCFGEPGRWKTLPHMTVDITGVPFFDVPHGQTGHAPNAIEIHPVLSIKTVSGSCN